MAFILMSYMLVATFLSGASAIHICCDEQEPMTEETTHNDSESCPSLCYCTCCGHLYIVDDPETEQQETRPAILPNPEFIPSFVIKAFPEGIWRPPQFG